MDELKKVLVIVPTYNELENIKIITKAIRTNVPQVDVLIVDDNSPDGTGQIADELSQMDPKIFVLHRKQKAGLGAAYLEGFAWAKNMEYDAVVEMDADGSHRPEDLIKILEKLANADVVLGSRWVSGGQVVNWPLHRKLLSQGGNLYTRMWLGIPIKDATGGFRAYRMQALEKIGLTDVQSQGYCFQVDMAWRAVKAGLKVVEVSIVFIERQLGESKMSGDIVKEALTKVTIWGLQKRFGLFRG